MDVVFGLIGLAGLIIFGYLGYSGRNGSRRAEFYTAGAAISVAELALTVVFFSYLPFYDYLLWMACAAGFTVAAYIEYRERNVRIGEYAAVHDRRPLPLVQLAPSSPVRPLPLLTFSKSIELIQSNLKVRSVNAVPEIRIEIETIPLLARVQGTDYPRYRVGPFIIRIDIPSKAISFETRGPTRYGMIAPHVSSSGHVCFGTFEPIFRGYFLAGENGTNEIAYGELVREIIRFLEEATPGDGYGNLVRRFDVASSEEVRLYKEL